MLLALSYYLALIRMPALTSNMLGPVSRTQHMLILQVILLVWRNYEEQ